MTKPQQQRIDLNNKVLYGSVNCNFKVLYYYDSFTYVYYNQFKILILCQKV